MTAIARGIGRLVLSGVALAAVLLTSVASAQELYSDGLLSGDQTLSPPVASVAVADVEGFGHSLESGPKEGLTAYPAGDFSPLGTAKVAAKKAANGGAISFLWIILAAALGYGVVARRHMPPPSRPNHQN